MKKIDTKNSLIFDAKMAKASLEYIGEDGYFSNFEDLSVCINGALKSVLVGDDVGHPYASMYDSHCYSFFIPQSKAVFIEEPAKKYRPFKDIGDFVSHMCLRDSGEVQFIGFRSKDCTSRYDLAYNGYELDMFGVAHIHLGSLTFTLYELFNNYEYELNSFEWVPFGVEE